MRNVLACTVAAVGVYADENFVSLLQTKAEVLKGTPKAEIFPNPYPSGPISHLFRKQAAQGAPCSSFECPVGYKAVTNASATCAGTPCVPTDLHTCCDWRQECSPTRTMHVANSTILRNNLGGLGPGSGDEGILLSNVFPASDLNVSLLISAVTNYKANNVTKNGIRGDFLEFNLRTNSKVTITFIFVDQNTLQPKQVPSFFMNFFDMDGMQNLYGREIITFNQADIIEDFLTPDTHVSTERSAGGTTVTYNATQWGAIEDNPTHPLSMTDLQRDRTVGLLFRSLSQFSATFRVSKQPRGWKFNGRKMMFSGSSALVCPGNAMCETMECPDGWKLRMGGEVCQGATCTVENDLNTCCKVSCGGSNFAFNQIAYNNLDNQGPESGVPSEMRFSNIRPGKDLVVTADVPPPYLPWNVVRNGPTGGGLFRINLKVDTDFSLNFKFVNSGTDVASAPFGFYFSVLDLDEQLEGKGREVVVPHGWDAYTVTPTTQVNIMQNGDAAPSFESSQKGTFEDNPENMSDLTQLQMDRAVTFMYENASTFQVTLKAVNGGDAGRNLYFGGASPIVCADDD